MSELTQYKTEDLQENLSDSLDGICSEEIASIGEKQGMFPFIEIFRTVNMDGVSSIKAELEGLSEMVGVAFDELLQSMPTLERLVK